MTLLTLARRQVASRPWPTALLALALALLAALATAVPALMADLDDRQLRQRLGALSAIAGDVSGEWTPDLQLGGRVVDPWPGYRTSAEAIRAAQPEPLASLLAEPQFVARFATTVSFVPPTESGYYRVTASLLADPDLAVHTRLVDGSWPEVALTQAEPLQVAVLDSLAERMGWGVGTVIDQTFMVSGLYSPVDAADVRWEHAELGRDYHELNDPNLGVELEAALFLPAATVGGDPTLRLQAPFTFQVWYRVDPARVGSTGLDVGLLTSQLTGLLASPFPMGEGRDGEPAAQRVRLTSELGEALVDVAAQQRTTRTVVALSATGPLGVGVALVLLGCRLVLERRRGTLTLVAARGMSPRQLRRLAVFEALAVGVPAAAIGVGVGAWLTPGPVPAAAWPAAAMVAALPAFALARGAEAVGARRARAELGARAGRWRIVGEAFIAALALAGTWQILTGEAAAERGARGGVDLLAVATPLLLALAGCLAVLRLYPLPLRLLHRRLRAGRALTGFLGSARALRDPAGGLIPVVTVLLGTTLAVTGAALVGTVSAGTERATWDEAGSSIHVSGPIITDELAAQIRGVGGVTAAARVRDAGPSVGFSWAGGSTPVRLWLADADLLEAYGVARGGSPVPASVFDGSGPASVVVGGNVPRIESAELDGVGAVHVAARLASLPGIEPGAAWVLADASRWTGAEARANVALVSVGRGVDADEVAERIRELVPNARVVTVTAELEALRDSPTIEGLTRLLVGLGAATAMLTLLTILASQLMASQERRSLGAVLRTLGMRPGQLRTLTAWELGPVVAVSLLVGVGLGVGIAMLLLAGVDFTALTGGAGQPSLYLDPLLLTAVAGGLLLAAGAAVLVSAAQAGRTDVAQELRIGEER